MKKKSSLKSIFLAFMFILPQQLFAAEAIGSIANILGKADIIRSGTTIPAKKDADLFESDELSAGEKTAVKILFKDGSTLSVFPNSKINLAEYKTRAKSGSNELDTKSVIDVVKGKVRFLVKPKESAENTAKFRTSNSVMGIRGTEGLIDNTDKTKVTLVVMSGSVEVYNTKFSTNSIVIPANSFTSVAPNRMPEPPKNVSAATMNELKKDTGNLNNLGDTGKKSLGDQLKEEAKNTPEVKQEGTNTAANNASTNQNERRQLFNPDGKTTVINTDKQLGALITSQSTNEVKVIVQLDTSKTIGEIQKIINKITEIIQVASTNTVTNSFLQFNVVQPSL